MLGRPRRVSTGPGTSSSRSRSCSSSPSSSCRPATGCPPRRNWRSGSGRAGRWSAEAVKILSATGRVSAQKGRGLYVADGEGVLGATRFGGFFMPTNLDHIFMLFEFRRIQEIAASRLAATQASPAELRVIEAAVQDCRRGHQTGDKAQFEAGDDAFHFGVAAASHNFFLVAAVREARRLQRQASVIGIRGVGGHAAEAVEEHDAIYRAIRDGQPDAAADATVVHLDNTLKDYRREIQRRVFGNGSP